MYKIFFRNKFLRKNKKFSTMKMFLFLFQWCKRFYAAKINGTILNFQISWKHKFNGKKKKGEKILTLKNGFPNANYLVSCVLSIFSQKFFSFFFCQKMIDIFASLSREMYDSKNLERPCICLQKWLLNQKVNQIKWKVRIGDVCF